MSLLLAAVIDLVCPLSSTSFSTSSPTTLPQTPTTTTTTVQPKTSTLNSTAILPASTNTSAVHTFSFTYSSARPKNSSESASSEDDLAEAESSAYALEEDDEDNGDFDGTFDEDSHVGNSAANFDQLNDLLTRSALSPEVAPSTADHYQVMHNRSASLKTFYDALTAAQDHNLSGDDQDDQDSAASLSNTELDRGEDPNSDDTEDSRQTIRLPSITTIVGSKSGLENRQDFLLPGSIQPAASSPSATSSSSSSFDYNRQQQLALYQQLSQMVQSSIANARGLSKAKGNSYVAAGAGKKVASQAPAASSAAGKSKKLQIVYIKVT